MPRHVKAGGGPAAREYLINPTATLDESTPEKASLLRLVKTLTRIEDLSHVLLWATETKGGLDGAGLLPLNAGRDGDIRALSVVELPRLRHKFVIKLDDNGIQRLWSLDHAGLFVSDDIDDNCRSLMVSLAVAYVNIMLIGCL